MTPGEQRYPTFRGIRPSLLNAGFKLAGSFVKTLWLP
jgi:hypothetical protein